jgi:hypothetical protein
VKKSCKNQTVATQRVAADTIPVAITKAHTKTDSHFLLNASFVYFASPALYG